MNPVSMKVFVIGYGNTLRGDDGIGYQVAETVAEWQLPQVRSIAVHQLLPELAADIADVDLVIFVDAIVTQDRAKPDITITPIFAGGDENFSTHIITPQLLLGITQKLYGATPVAYLLTIPAIDFTLGANLSSIACRGKELALDYLKSALEIVGQFGSIEATGSE
ncbi:hydrogenase maturation protease [Chamaesiphon sp. OTE_75_metabat_556]|uniref:hydrogenase maturation protease n=1 Tax=Chamaesiphon sp. OTE_75_metabat_556 TaxID=2964692 RepID=UPI00286C1317|nr:hydrogenase maturation protease [Chamaesiphon sp. OTE_75_metabat_556]